MSGATSAPTNMACRRCSQTAARAGVLQSVFYLQPQVQVVGVVHLVCWDKLTVAKLTQGYNPVLSLAGSLTTSTHFRYLSPPTFPPLATHFRPTHPRSLSLSLSLHQATACGVPDGAKRVVSFGLSPWLACLLGLGLVGSERHQGGRSTEASREG